MAAKTVSMEGAKQASAPYPRTAATLVGTACLRHEHNTAHAGDLRGVGQTLAVVSCRKRNDSTLALLRREPEDRIEGAARLERPGPLEILRLQAEMGIGDRAEGRRFQDRRAMDVGSNALCCGTNVVQRDVRGRGALILCARGASCGGDVHGSGGLWHKRVLTLGRGE